MLEKRRSNLNIVTRLVRVISFYLVARLAVNNEPRDRRGIDGIFIDAPRFVYF